MNAQGEPAPGPRGRPKDVAIALAAGRAGFPDLPGQPGSKPCRDIDDCVSVVPRCTCEIGCSGLKLETAVTRHARQAASLSPLWEVGPPCTFLTRSTGIIWDVAN